MWLDNTTIECVRECEPNTKLRLIRPFARKHKIKMKTIPWYSDRVNYSTVTYTVDRGAWAKSNEAFGAFRTACRTIGLDA